VSTSEGVRQWGSNAYIVQALANLFQAHVVIGLEDSVYEANRRLEAYSAAFHFLPGNQPPTRYEKQILVPMGEYIPFHWCREMAASYGITGSFTCGRAAKVFQGPVPFGASICYEEIYGDLMRQNRLQGAKLLVNLTNDGWFPHSRLPKQHFDHARLRTVENGIPLVRACNTGITGAVDSLGRIIGVLGEDPLHAQDLADSLRLNIPLYHYQTLYMHFGDLPILGLSCLCLLGGLCRLRRD
jgi:apolipoprotein N-acyltransferase